MSVITVTHLDKAYKQYPTIGARLREWMLGGRKTYHQLHWVLRDIHFSVNKGEAVGLVGVNGAGKSTLLKLITGTSHPTMGAVRVKGKISALLELGSGFHPEFTGRQNIFIMGQLSGFQRREIECLLPEIAAFAEIGAHLDQPVRVYSSGMKMRLAFSIATAIRPDIMIVDEALSVGDSYFQHKCYQRIREMLKQGMALLFVSHDSHAVTSICERAILLHKGSIAMQGPAEVVMNYYKALLADVDGKQIQQHAHVSGKLQTISGTNEASLITIDLYNDRNESVHVINVGDRVRLSLVVQAHVYLASLTVGYEIKDHYGRPIFGTNTHHLEQHLVEIIPSERITLDFHFAANIGIGEYSISVALHTGAQHVEKNYEWRELALIFNVSNVDKSCFLGTSWLPPEVRCSRPARQVSEYCSEEGLPQRLR